MVVSVSQSEMAVEMKKVTFNYPDGQCGLKDITLNIYCGESVGLIGPNGAGKSTLLLHLNGILRGTGEIYIRGLKVEDKNIRKIRKMVGMVFQDPEDQLFSLNVFDDVAFGPLNLGWSDEEVTRKVSSALARVGMSGYEKRSSHHLSIGEKKRVAIATVLSMDPEILVLDEPSSSLDPRGKSFLISVIQELPVTRIVASHDLELVKKICNRIIILDKGSVVADSNAEEIMGDRSLLDAHGLL
jgi:cobalt/nickel transport system ATP-binding protein